MKTQTDVVSERAGMTPGAKVQTSAVYQRCKWAPVDPDLATGVLPL